jgi:HlyD family secretion protein
MESQDEGTIIDIAAHDYPAFINDTGPIRRVTPLRRFFAARHRWIMALVTVVLLAAIILVAFWPRSTGPQYNLFNVRLGTLTVTTSSTGTLQGTLYGATPAAGSVIAEIDVKVGQSVKAGTALARLDPTSLQNAVSSAQANVTAAQNQVDAAQTNLSNVQSATQAQLTAAKDQETQAIAQCKQEATPTPNCVQTAQDQYAAAQGLAQQELSAAQQEVSAAQSQLTIAQNELQQAQQEESAATLTAPHAGVIAAINGQVGGSPTGTPFIQIVDLSQLHLLTSVGEHIVTSVTAGDPVSFTVDAVPGNTFSGQVSAISPVGQNDGHSVAYPVTVDVNMADVPSTVTLLAGMSAHVTIQTANRTDVMLIPTQTVSYAKSAAQHNRLITGSQALTAQDKAQSLLQQQQPDFAKDNPTAAYVIVKTKGRYTAKPVVLGLNNGTFYEVLSGLAASDSVVTGEN